MVTSPERDSNLDLLVFGSLDQHETSTIMTLIQPNPEMQLRIRTELNEDVSTRNQDLEHIKEWVSKQPHLPQFQDDGRLMTFLRGCKFSLEKTKRKLDMYFTMRAAIPEFFSNRDVNRKELQDILSKRKLMTSLRDKIHYAAHNPKKLNQPPTTTIQRALFRGWYDNSIRELPNIHGDARRPRYSGTSGYTMPARSVPHRKIMDECSLDDSSAPVRHIPPLPGLTPNGRRVIVMQGITKDIIPPNVADGMKLVLMIGDIRLKEELTGVAGDVYILDASVATAAHFAKFTPSIVKKFLVCVQEAYPVKLKEVHVVNVSPLVDTIINFAKPFLKEKIRNRIFCHPDGYESLYKYIPQEILPSEYGGYAGPIDVIHREWVKKLDSYTEWFKEQEDIKADESKRPGKPKTHDDLFGLEGSFRQLLLICPEFDPIPDPLLYRKNLEMQGIKPETAGSVASMHQPRCSSGKRVWERRICLPQTYLPKIAKVCLNVGGPRAMQRIRASKTSTVCLLLKKRSQLPPSRSRKRLKACLPELRSDDGTVNYTRFGGPKLIPVCSFARGLAQRVIQTFDEEDAVSIREAKVATSSSTVVSDLAYVKSYFGNLPGVIVSLEARDLPFIESVKIMHTIQESVKQTPGPEPRGGFSEEESSQKDVEISPNALEDYEPFHGFEVNDDSMLDIGERQAHQGATVTESDMLAGRGPGRSKLMRTGRRGRPTKIYQPAANRKLDLNNDLPYDKDTRHLRTASSQQTMEHNNLSTKLGGQRPFKAETVTERHFNMKAQHTAKKGRQALNQWPD
uniref:CRAL-TRIO domain-containing protein n=1 Tax=Timema douglasi TaxID=61478 RepID=A0A7R8VIR7_TIMDO|nr:unnamed protein product [Timema douglasi]